MSAQWFDVDKDGLAKLLEQRGKVWAAFELIENAIDENSKTVDVMLTRVDGTRSVQLVVADDNPDGFKDLKHAYTMFAESPKKGDPTKRGWMDMGEKLVVACCSKAEIASTTGTVIFGDDGRSMNSRAKRKAGSQFTGIIKMTNTEMQDVVAGLHRLIPPPHVQIFVNGEQIKHRDPVTSFEASLQTRYANEDGVMVKTVRKTKVNVYAVLPGEEATIYEMGIPVVATGDKYHCDIQQRVPLNTDRDNVPPAYLRELRTLVLNATYKMIGGDEAATNWVRDAASSDKVAPEAFQHVLKERYGDKVVGADPSDREGENIAKAQGYVIVQPRSLTAGEWENVRKTQAFLPAGKVTPSTPEGTAPVRYLKFHELTEGMIGFSAYVKRVAMLVLGHKVHVDFIESRATVGADYSRDSKTVRFNVTRLGKSFFDKSTAEADDLIIHELGHEIEGNHLSSKYNEALTRFAGILIQEALRNPGFFRRLLACRR